MSTDPDSSYSVAIDIGGTQMRAALVRCDGFVYRKANCSTQPERGFENATKRLISLVRSVVRSVMYDQLVGVGISSAGPINPETGVYNNPPSLLGWHGLTMKSIIAQSTNLAVTIEHDARAAALAETRFGAAVGRKHVVYVTVSTGIGGGIISNGQLVTGTHGWAGEIGHLIIDPNGPSCNAGCSGCLEVLASGGGVAREARMRIQSGDQSVLLDLANGDPCAITGRHVYEACAVGDSVASEIVENALHALSVGFSNILATFDPDLLIVGGSVVEGLSPHWEDLLSRVRKQGLIRYVDKVPIQRSPLGADVSILGASAVAFDASNH